MAIIFEKIQPGMTLWDVRRTTGWEKASGNKWSIWPVHVKDINHSKRTVYASWNGNRFEWMQEQQICKYRAKRPDNNPVKRMPK